MITYQTDSPWSQIQESSQEVQGPRSVHLTQQHLQKIQFFSNISQDDDFYYSHSGTHEKKMHTGNIATVASIA